MSTAFFVLLCAGFVGFGLYQWWFSAAEVAKRELKATPALPSKHLLPGQVAKVSGGVVLLESLAAPLTGAPCAYWRLWIEVPHGKNSWRAVVDVEKGVPFLIDDGSGQPVYVAPGDARLVVNDEKKGTVGLFDEANPDEAALLDEHGLERTTVGFNKTYRFRIATLEAHEQVAVRGEADLREVDGVMRVVLVAPAEGELVVSDAAGVHG